ncbi:MAG: 1-deoxy-D-xylulose-5-phosphate reductoisomerase, partial [Alphaproteobacteria bacterium]
MSVKTIAIFGSTGSIGTNTLKVIRNAKEKFKVKILVAKNDFKNLILQALEFSPEFVVIENKNYLSEVKEALSSLKNCQILAGSEAILDVAKVRCDLAVCAIVGSAGMMPTYNAILAKSNIALANKESLVCAGEFIIEQAKKNQV